MVGRSDGWISGWDGPLVKSSVYSGAFHPRKSRGFIVLVAFAVCNAGLRVPRSAVPSRSGRVLFRPGSATLLKAPLAARSLFWGPLLRSSAAAVAVSRTARSAFSLVVAEVGPRASAVSARFCRNVGWLFQLVAAAAAATAAAAAAALVELEARAALLHRLAHRGTSR